jgi:arginine utilization protein RocB
MVIKIFYSLYILNARLKYSVSKNGSVIGLKLNGSVISTVNNIDSLLAKKADKAIVDEMVDQFKTEREEFDKFKEESAESIKTKIDLAFFYDYMTSINEQISNLGSKSTASQKEVQHLELSDPPTPEELEALNSLQVGDLYTLNGGTSVLVFREPLK